MPMIEVAGDVCLSRPRPTRGCRADDDDDDGPLLSFEIRSQDLLSYKHVEYLQRLN
jgi:hypothetical protein